MRYWAAIAVLSIAAISDSTAQQRPQVAGYFSDMRYTSGDLVGITVWIVYSDDFWATVQVAEGHSTAPMVALVGAAGRRVEFGVEEPIFDQGGKPLPPRKTFFGGTVTEAGLMLDSGEFLKRRNSWQ